MEGILITQLVTILILVFILLIFFRQNRVNHYEERFEKFSLNFVEEDKEENSLITEYLKKLTKILMKISFLKKLSRLYKSYEVFPNEMNFNEQDLIAFKVVIFLFTILMLIIQQFSLFLVGVIIFFGIDYIYYYRKFKKRQEINQEIYNILFTIKNSFQLGFSLRKTIKYLSKNYTGILKKELVNFNNDLNYGLTFAKAWERLNQRLDLPLTNKITYHLTKIDASKGDINQALLSCEEFVKKPYSNLTVSKAALLYTLLYLSLPLLFVIGLVIFNYSKIDILLKSPFIPLVLVAFLMLFFLYYLVFNYLLKGKYHE